jgi:RNA-directed DNA polymerase
VEGRVGRVKEPLKGKVKEMPSSEDTSTKLQRIAELASQAPEMAFTSLSHHMDTEFLREAHRRVRKDGAVGVDGQTAAEYEVRLEENLQSLLGRFKSGTYQAPPVRRAYIPKGDGSGRQRPLGIPTFEDKILQRAVAMVLEAVYEQDFLDCSYAFRPGRSAHQALAALWQGVMDMGGGWVIDLDIQSFYDTLDHGHLRSFLDRRVRDGVLRRTIGKWLKAGVLEAGAVRRSEEGTPQGGVISPVLSNIYLHEVLDVWFDKVVKPRLAGRAVLVRYADDALLVFSCEDDARRVMDVLPKRFERYGLTLHPVKTRLVDFRPEVRRHDEPGDGGGEHSFDVLGFTLYWGKSRAGRWVVKRKTATKRVSATLRRITAWCRRNRHAPVREQHETLVQKLRGHYAYYGLTGNSRSLARVAHEVARIWRKWLNRRSWKSRMNWQRFTWLLTRYPLPPPRIVHSVHHSVANP